MTDLLVALVVATILWFVWRFVSAIFGPRSPAEPKDPNAGVPVLTTRGPKDKTGAVALEEPEDDDLQSFPPRSF